MKICKNCNSKVNDGDLFCSNCGAKIDVTPDTAGKQNPNHSGNTSQAFGDMTVVAGAHESNRKNLSPVDFYKGYASDKIKKSVRTIMVIGLVFAGLNLLICLIGRYAFGLIDVAAIVGFSLWFYSRPEKLPAYCLLGYTSLSIIIGLCLTGTFSGWLLLIWSIGAIKTAASVNNEYTEFIGR